jgi:hypothetical protein
MTDFILKTGQSVLASVAFSDVFGNPVVAGGTSPIWSALPISQTVLTVTPSEDGLSAMVTAIWPTTSPIGATRPADIMVQVSVTDQVSGSSNLLNFRIVSGLAATALLSAGIPFETVTPVITPSV